MENSFREEKNIFGLQVDEVSKSHLLNTAKWTKFLAIIAIIFLSFFLLALLFMGTALLSGMSMTGGADPAAVQALGTKFVAIYAVVVLALTFYPIYCMMKFSNKIKAAINTSNQVQFNSALGSLKNLFKFYGILTIIIIGLYAVGIAYSVMSINR